MLDYKNIKEACDLAEIRYDQGKFTRISLNYIGSRRVMEYRLITSIDGDHDWLFDNIEGLLKKLKQETLKK